MHTGMAPLAEGDEVFGCIIGPVTVQVMDVEILISATEPASVTVPCQNDFPELFPFLQPIFVPHRDRHIVAPTEEDIAVSLSIWTGVAEAPVAVQPWAVPAGWDASGLK